MPMNIRNSRIRHKYIATNDYIKNPKPSGYRSLHIVFQFHSETKSKEDYNRKRAD